ncbi:MAG: helix-turn-helix domain-containing protein [Nanoarchaeota archaeon]|nr:helix-turn-helix domain-containing protein [Nanoarchaeota archaeon]
MFEENLLEIGFTKNETQVYFAILDLGECKTGEILKKANINTGRIYDILNKLIEKGLVSNIIKNNTKFFYATNPLRLIDYIEEKKSILEAKEKDIRNMLPELIKKNQSLKKTYRTEVYQGIQGIKSFLKEISDVLSESDTFYIMGVPLIDNKNLSIFLQSWNQERINKKFRLKIIYNYEARSEAKKRKKLELTEVKIMKKGVVTPAWIDIVRDYVAIITLEKNPTCIVIKNEEVANSYLKFFDMIWNLSTEE